MYFEVVDDVITLVRFSPENFSFHQKILSGFRCEKGLLLGPFLWLSGLCSHFVTQWVCLMSHLSSWLIKHSIYYSQKFLFIIPYFWCVPLLKNSFNADYWIQICPSILCIEWSCTIVIFNLFGSIHTLGLCW